jgi:uncharacterized protein YjiS (DUF1127 family)
MSTIDTIRKAGAPVLRFEGGFGPLLENAMQRLAVMVERRRSRRLLLELTDEQLRDIGISRIDAHDEAHRPFWD